MGRLTDVTFASTFPATVTTAPMTMAEWRTQQALHARLTAQLNTYGALCAAVSLVLVATLLLTDGALIMLGWFREVTAADQAVALGLSWGLVGVLMAAMGLYQRTRIGLMTLTATLDGVTTA